MSVSQMKDRPVLDRLLPARIDNHFCGHRAALWLLGLHVALKLIMSLNSIFNTRSVATGADGLRLDTLPPDSAQELLLLFALVVAISQLFLTLSPCWPWCATAPWCRWSSRAAARGIGAAGC